MWDSVDDMASTHELPTRYRQLFMMFGRSPYEKETDPLINAPATSFGVISYSPPRGAPSMNNESIIWWKLLPSRQKLERSTSK